MRHRGPFRDPAWLAVVLVCAAGVLTIAALITSRLLLPAEGATIPTGDWPWTADGVVVQPLSPEGPFRAGDLVVAIDGRPLADWASDAFRPPWFLGARPLGPTIAVDVVRNGAPLAFVAPIEPFAIDRLGGAPLGLVVFGATALILALALIIRRPQATALRLIVLAVTCDVTDIVAWETGLQPTDLVARTPFLYAFGLAAIFSLVFWSSLIHLLSTYPIRARWLVRRPSAVFFVYAAPLAALAVGATLAALSGGGSLAWIARLGPLTAAIASAAVVALLAAIVTGYRRTPALRRPQVRLLAVTLFVAAGAILVFVSGPIALSRPPIVPRGTVALLALPVVAALALAVIRDHLFQVDLVASSRARIVAAREEERLRLRRELHDGLGPTLAALGLKIDAARADAVAGDAAAAATALEGIRSDVRGILGQIRSLARDLRPPTLDSLGLVGGLRQQVDALITDGGTRVDIEAADLPVLPAGVEVAAYRIVIEAVTNIVRHADATTATVRLGVDDRVLRVEIDDDGVGGGDEGIGVGTRAMYERAAEVGGELAIEPGRIRGTRVIALLPLGERPRSPDGQPTATATATGAAAIRPGVVGPGVE